MQWLSMRRVWWLQEVGILYILVVNYLLSRIGLVSDVQGTPSAFYFCIRVFCFFFPSLFFWTGSKKWCLPVTPHWGWQLVSRINSYIFLIFPPFVYARWQREYVVLGLEEWSQFSAIPNNCTAWYVFRAFSICSLWLWGWKWP